MSDKINKLPPELKELVRKSVAILGEVIKEEAGEGQYKLVEKIRVLMTEYRADSDEKRSEKLRKLYSVLEKKNKKSKHEVAQSFTLMLELINACESAYRTYRLQQGERTPPKARQENMMVYVLTAHPTEARTPMNIELFQRVQNVLIRILDKSGEEKYMMSIIKHNLKLAWLLPVTRHEKPKVSDEANHLFSIILRDDIFDSILRSDRDYGGVRIRTWVGGDKDGHPGVDEVVMLECLEASRSHFIRILNQISNDIHTDIEALGDKNLSSLYKRFCHEVSTCLKIEAGDAKRVSNIKSSLEKLSSRYTKIVGDTAPRLKKMASIFKLFPGLVIPIELREDSEVILSGLSAARPIAIERMLIKLNEISEGKHLRNYAQGFIISMCHSYEDIQNTTKLLKRSMGGINFPIIPLFETAQALEDSSKIVEQILNNKTYMKTVAVKWDNHLEVMLGYSDSSKGMGVLPSRVAIAKTIRDLDQKISERNVIPVFFHGSGGSVDRGGGSLKDQTAWWPKSALNIYKATIQGEMVERNFTSAEVAMSGMNKVLENFNRVKTKKGTIQIDKAVDQFSEKIKAKYIDKIKDPDFYKMVESATPYSYLSVLKLGSRPTKRAKASKLDLNSIRAIPWILCWTQTRVLFPTWWGVGSAWKESKRDKKFAKSLKHSNETSFLFASYIRVLGFTLSKVDMSIFAMYLEKSDLDKNFQKAILEEFRDEYRWAVDFVREMTGNKNLLWYKPWLADSIELRSSMIHPLNILQILAYRENDSLLIRKTVAGISSGMMTTG